MSGIITKGRCCNLNSCATCAKCIYDEDYIGSGIMEKGKKICNACQYAKPTLISRGSIVDYHNWHCVFNGDRKLIEMSYPSNKDVNLPTWCPKCKSTIDETSNVTITTPLTFTQKRDILEKIPPLMSWDDIKEKEVYHVPPIPSETRKDIYIISKNDFSCTYRVLSSSQATSNGTILTMYKTSLIYKFMQKHKLKTIEVVNITSNK